MSLARRSLQVVAFICTLVVGAASMAVIVTQTAWFKEWLRGFIVRQADDYVNGRLSIGRLDGNLFFGVDLQNVEVTMNGDPVVSIQDVGLDYNFLTFLSGGVVLDDIRLNEPVFHVARTAEGWNITRLIRARTPDGPGRPITIGEIGVTGGTLHFEGEPVGTAGVDMPARIEGLDATVAVSSDAGDLTVDIGHVSLRAEGPSLHLQSLSGTVRRTAGEIRLENIALRTDGSSLRVDGAIEMPDDAPRRFDLVASSERFDMPELSRLIPLLRGYDLAPAFEIAASGPLDRLEVDLAVRDGRLGGVTGNLIVDGADPTRTVAGSVILERFNVDPLVQADMTSNVTGRAQIDLALPSGRLPLSGTFTLDADSAEFAGYRARDVDATGRIDGRTVRVDGSAAGYGGRATAAGTIQLQQPTILNLAGRAAGVDLRNLPAQLNMPGAPSDLQFAYTLNGRGGVYAGALQFEASTLAGASIAPGTEAEFELGGGRAPRYAARGEVAGLDVQQVGTAFGIEALASERYAGHVNTTFDLAGSGGGRYPLTLDATGTAVDSEMFGATFPRLAFTAAFAGGDARIGADGSFADLDPAVVTRNDRLEGRLTGAVDAVTTLRNYAGGVTVDSVDVAGRVVLQDSRLADLDIASATVAGTYANRSGELSELEIAGPDLTASGKGTIALDDTGMSNLALHVETPSLDRLGELIDQPLKGAAIVDATVTGNATELRADGTLQGSNIGHGDHEALSLQSMFAVRMPDLAPEAATIDASGTATFVEVAGQQIQELTADVAYAQSRLEFDAVAQEGTRELAAQGTAIFHPDHREVHVTNLALRTEGVEWQTAPGTEATVQWTGDRVAVDNVQLVSGAQRIEADGVIGSPAERLRVRAENVDIAQLDRLLLGDERLVGTLDADAEVWGSTDALRAEGTFAVTQGAFRGFLFESLAGELDYAGRGFDVDVRLQQSPQSWLTATGYVPLSLFQRSPAGTGHQAPEAGEAIDLQVSSSQIDLGVIQGFTSYLTNVTGVLQADVRVTGTGDDPHVDGVIDIRGGAFAVPDLGTAYTGLDTRIDLETDLVTISEMRLVDEHGETMTVGGRLAVHERAVGDVDVTISSENFEVIDNELADLKLDTEVRVSGELRAPRVQGFVEVEAGTIDVARVLERVTSDPYAVTPIDAAAAAAATATPALTVPSLFDALDLTLGIAIPGNLVLRGSDVRAANAPIDIGDMVITVGGAVQISKPPDAEPRLTGEVNTIRGTYTFQGRRFEILRDGRIRFAGTGELNPLVELRARRVISGVETFVRVQGTLRQPELTFSSSPPLDQADILSLIVFNVPANELGAGQQISLVETAGALAGGYLTSGLTRSIADALEIDEFEIQAAQAEGGLAPSLIVGEQVGERLFFRIRQGFGAEQATELILEYQIADFLRAQAAVAETTGGTQRVTFRRIERAGLDLIFFFSY